jgi:hypothetical protein
LDAIAEIAAVVLPEGRKKKLPTVAQGRAVKAMAMRRAYRIASGLTS